MTAGYCLSIENAKIAVIGQGYVGLPLSVALGRRYPTIGFDLNEARLADLRRGLDATQEVDAEEIKSATLLSFSSDEQDIAGCNVYIVAVPTPIDASRRPNLHPLVSASETVGKVLKRGDVVIYESTVYPGATEEDCVPILEAVSGLRFNQDFFAGYSPERVNPGDRARPLTRIVKVTSGSTPEVASFVDDLYASIIEVGTYKASSIRVAEAAKVIENTQRDVNIALVNELSIILSRLGIDTNEVMDAAATKWNFIRMSPGLVGGHCIGVDPYYLLHKSLAAGHIPDIIRTAREINDGMPRNAAARLIKAMAQAGLVIKGAKVLCVGVTFKENCPDTRNTQVVRLIQQIEDYGASVDVVDPWADPVEVLEEYGVTVASELPSTPYDAVILAVPHRHFVEMGASRFRAMAKPGGIFFDMKAAFGIQDSELRL